MHNIRLKIAYDGTNYLGWQKTKEGPSIEETLQLTLEQILQESIILQAASRTDAGVHAHGQVVNFLTSKANLELARLKTSLNQLLPKDIVIIDASEAHSHFHPTLNAVGKEYRYSICLGPYQLPEHRLYSWHCYQAIDVLLIKDAIPYFLGEHDFAAFCNFQKNKQYESTVRTLQEISLIFPSPNRLCISIKGDHFLYKMARNIAGTLVYIGQSKLVGKDITMILKNKKRFAAGITAPAHGLALYEVFYDLPSIQ